MAEFNLPDFSIGTETALDDVAKLVKIVRSDWDTKEVEIKRIFGGFSCNSYLAYSKDNPHDGITIRVRKLFSKVKLATMNSEFELKIVKIMSERGFFTKLNAIFKNGYCYQYVPGKALISWVDKTPTRDEKDIPLKEITKNLAKIHCVNVEGEDYSKTEIFDKYLRVLDENYPNETSDSNILDKSILEKEFKELTGRFKNMDPKIVLCHGDMHPGNMIWNEEKEHFSFIDWEMCHVGYQAQDLAFFLITVDTYNIARELDLPKMPVFIDKPTEQFKKDLIRFYLQEFSLLTTGSVENLEEQFVILEKQVKFYVPIIYLILMILLGVLHEHASDSGLPADMSKYMPMMFKLYKKAKADVLGDMASK